MGALQPWHWIVVIAVVLLLFGANRLPGLAKSVGQSMKIFKREVTELREDGKDTRGRDRDDDERRHDGPGREDSRIRDDGPVTRDEGTASASGGERSSRGDDAPKG